MQDWNTSAELQHDEANSARADASASHLSDALDDVVERVLDGKRVGDRFTGIVDLQCFLEDQPDLSELVSTAKVSRDWLALDTEIEKRLRVHLQDSEVVLERAEEFANEPDEQP